MFKRMLSLAALAVVAGSVAYATAIPVFNADFETQSSGQFGGIEGWGPNGGWAFHAGFSKPGNAGLGERFGYTTPRDPQIVRQIIPSVRFEAGLIYNFKSWAMGGGNDSGTVFYQIGYALVDDDSGTFVPLSSNAIQVGGTWMETAGVTHTVAPNGFEIGKQLIIQFGSGPSDDVWLDNVSATVVPEPGTIAAVGLGLATLARRRRK